MKFCAHLFMALTLILNTYHSCPDTPLCTLCTGDICQHCEWSSFNTTDKSCVPINSLSIVDNCRTYQDNQAELATAICIECELGYKLDEAKNFCEPCVDGSCAFCPNRTDECYACFHRLMLNENENNCNSTKKCPLWGCQVCQTISHSPKTTTCLMCYQSYTRHIILNKSDIQLGRCKPNIGNCLTADIDFGKCLECLPGFYITGDKTCLPNPSPPAKMSETNKGVIHTQSF